MHQVGNARHRLDLHAYRTQLVDERPVDLRRRRHGDGLGVVLVEDQADGDAALDRRLEGVEHGGRRRPVEAQVVDGDVERFRRSVEKGCDALRDRVGVLAAVGEEIEIEGGYLPPAFGSPVCSLGRSTLTGRGRVTISAASVGASVGVMRVMSSRAIAPAASTCSFSQSISPLQYGVPKSTIGKCSILPAFARVSDSNSSSSVPKPPGKITKPRAYFTNMFLRSKRNGTPPPRPSYLFSDSRSAAPMCKPHANPPPPSRRRSPAPLF